MHLPARLKMLTLSTRLTLAMVALVLFTATAVGVFSYRSIEAAMLPRALERAVTHVNLLASELKSDMRGAYTDALGFRAAVAVQEIIAARLGIEPRSGVTEAEWRKRLATRFAAELAVNPEYYQFRMIANDDGGREIIRVDRSGPDGAIRIVPDSELRRRGETEYFKTALRLPPGKVYVSPIELNKEDGKIEVPYVPVVHFATSIQTPSGEPFGILVINVDMRPSFARARAAMRPGVDIFIVNERGDYLVNPEQSREFGFEFGRPARLQDDFPALARALSANEASSEMISDAAGERLGAAVAPMLLANGLRVVMIETVDHLEIMAPVIAMRNAGLAAGFAATFVAIALAILLARSLTRPLVQMTGAVQAFVRDEVFAAPISAGGEIGTLARAFARMAGDMRDKTIALKREIEERRRIFETSLDLILVVDRQGTFIQVSPSSATILGYQPEEMIGHVAAEFIHPDDLESTRNEMRAARRGQHLRNFETRYVHKDGRVVSLSWTGVWSKPERQHFFIGRNVTEEKVAQRMFRLAVDSCPSGMVMIDAAGKIVLVNDQIEQLFGYGREELIGRLAEALVPGMLALQDARPRNFADPETHRMGVGRDLSGLHKDGTKFPAEVSINRIQIGEGLLVLGVIVDLSERRHTERLKDEFVSTVSHELRTPLTSISGSLGLLAGQVAGKLPETAARLLAIAYKNSQRLVRLINDILDIEKLESGQVVFNLGRLEVRELVEQAIEANRGFAEGYGVRVRLDAASAGGEVNADPDRLAQVITNLLSNAIKFSPPGEEVLVAVEKDGDVVRMSVRDHGPGIPADFKPHIFEKFAQADATNSRQKGGTGLGLSIVKQIVERLGGDVGFDEAPGGGTIFRVELPAWDHAAGREIDLEAEPGAARLLLCEDDRETAIAMRERLRQAGFAADFAYTAAAAVMRAEETHYFAILVDLRLPDGDGIGLILRLRAQAQYRDTPIIVISGDSSRGRDDARSSRLNVLDWLNKPVDFEHLVRTLRMSIAREQGGSLRILHVDDDHDVLAAVAQALSTTADVVSVDSIEAARHALAADRIDLAVLDISLNPGSGLDLLPDLRDSRGDAIPVIIFSAQGAGLACDEQIQAAVAKSHASLENLVATVRDRLALLSARTSKEVV